jgi:hypothetical protein
MSYLEAGDLVRIADSYYQALVIGSADEPPLSPGAVPTWVCVWECDSKLFQEIFSEDSLILVRKERRRIPRGGTLIFPCNDHVTPVQAMFKQLPTTEVRQGAMSVRDKLAAD